MKPQEFIDKWLGWAKNKEEINDEILADLEAMNQALRIHDVVGRSEQLVLFADWLQYNGKWDLPEKQAKNFLEEQKQN